MTWIIAWIRKNKELITYGIVGGCTTAVNYASYCLFLYVCALSVDVANALSIGLAVLFAYATNKRFVFQTRCADAVALFREAAAFFSSRAVTMLIEFWGVFGLVRALGQNEMFAKVAMGVLIIIVNYIFSKRFVFGKADTEAKGPENEA